MPQTLTGWLLDLYADPQDGVVLWLLDEADGVQRHRLRQVLPLTFYIAGPAPRLRALWRYLTMRPEPNTPQVAQLFLSEKGLPLRKRWIQSLITYLGNKAGITGVRVSPHTLRHSFAKQYLICGGDVFSLQKILGHNSLEVVKLYVNLLPGEVSAQHRKFSPADNMGTTRTGPATSLRHR